MKTLRSLLLIGALFVAGVIHSQYILNLDLVQMNDYIGKMCKVRVSEISTGKEVARKTIDAISNPAFSVELYALLHGRSYNVDIIVDLDGDGEYDAPPTDHAWRRVVNNASMHTNLTFAPDQNFTDTGCPDAFPFSQYDSNWGGKWFNLTFGSTDSIKASFRITCDSVFGFFMTKGLFGNPQTVMFNFAQALSEGSVGDTIKFSLPAPWTGEICIIEERITADLALMGLQLQWTGTVGAKQILCLYQVLTGGNPFANGYFYIRELSIASSSPELEVGCEMSNVSCNGAMDGFVSVTPSGGTADYTYQWSNGVTTQTIGGLGPGEFCVTVTDADGCTAVKCVTITEAPALTMGSFVTNEVCHGECLGRINAFGLGGTLPYTYVWNDGLTLSIRDSLCAGIEYSITVTDGAGCTSSLSFILTEPDPIVIQVESVVHEANGMGNGSINVSVTGGTSPYFYSWSKDGVLFSNDEDVTNLSAGMYRLTVVDTNVCVVMSEIFEIQNISGVAELTTQFRCYPNPASSYLYVEADAPVSVDCYDAHGQWIIYSPMQVRHIISTDALSSGVYVLRIGDGNGVSLRKVIVLK